MSKLSFGKMRLSIPVFISVVAMLANLVLVGITYQNYKKAEKINQHLRSEIEKSALAFLQIS